MRNSSWCCVFRLKTVGDETGSEKAQDGIGLGQTGGDLLGLAQDNTLMPSVTQHQFTRLRINPRSVEVAA